MAFFNTIADSQGLETLRFGSGQLSPGVHDHGKALLLELALDPFDQVDPVDIGQPEIEDQAIVGGRSRELRQHLLTGADAGDRNIVAFDHVLDDLALAGVVFGNQHVPRSRLQEIGDGREHRTELGDVGGFVQGVDGAHSTTAAVVVRPGNDVDRYVARGEVMLEDVENNPAGHIRQADVQGDGGGLPFLRQRQSPFGRFQ